MARQITILTPENIPITLELAGLSTRLGALMVDVAIQTTVLIFVALAVALAAAIMSLAGLGAFGMAAIYIGSFVIMFGYFIFFEMIWNGQTPGKRVFGLRVVRDGGYPVNFFCVATRNLLRIADAQPFLAYGVGAASVFFNPQYRRLGDLVAGTLVVKERAGDPFAAFKTGPAAFAGRLPETVNDPSEVLTPAELLLLRRFVLRRFEMTPDDGERLAYRLIAPLVGRLNIQFLEGVPPRYADLAVVIVYEADARAAERERAG